jgi:hypothetical protein
VPIQFRPYQIPIFQDNTTGASILHWSRQIGKSYVLAAWFVDRLLSRPGRLLTVLSNSRQNGIEFADKCQAICAEHGVTFQSSNSVDLETSSPNPASKSSISTISKPKILFDTHKAHY